MGLKREPAEGKRKGWGVGGYRGVRLQQEANPHTTWCESGVGVSLLNGAVLLAAVSNVTAEASKRLHAAPSRALCPSLPAATGAHAFIGCLEYLFTHTRTHTQSGVLRCAAEGPSVHLSCCRLGLAASNPVINGDRSHT